MPALAVMPILPVLLASLAGRGVTTYIVTHSGAVVSDRKLG
jgi:hypothetical protein